MVKSDSFHLHLHYNIISLLLFLLHCYCKYLYNIFSFHFGVIIEKICKYLLLLLLSKVKGGYVNEYYYNTP